MSEEAMQKNDGQFDERVKAKRHAYLLNLANELMTAPIDQLEIMYNESDRRSLNTPNSEIYSEIKGILEQVAEKRCLTIVNIDAYFRFIRQQQ